jgi:DNA-binding transcriptional LysR family regulator
MELRQLRYFIAVAERLSFSKAAQHLHITVPPLSRQVRQLEEEFGVQLFVRDRRNVALTDAGRALLREAKILVTQSAHVTDCVRLAKCGEAGLVKIGIGMGLGEPISRVLIEHSKQFPSVDLQYRDMFSSWQNKALIDGDIDVGFLRPFVDSAHLMTEVLFQENFVVHLCRSNPLAKRRTLKIKDLAGEKLLMPNRGGSTYLYDRTFELYAEAGVTPNVIHVPLDPVPHSDTQIVLLTCHKGIFIMPDEVACRPAQGSEVVALPLDEPNARIDVHIAWRRAEKSATVLAFVDTSRRVFCELPKRGYPSDRGKPPALNLIPQAERRS